MISAIVLALFLAYITRLVHRQTVASEKICKAAVESYRVSIESALASKSLSVMFMQTEKERMDFFREDAQWIRARWAAENEAKKTKEVS